MSKARSFRFSLSTLLLLVACAGLFTAYARQRSAAIFRASRTLEAEGVRLQWKGGSANRFWPSIPRTASLEFNELSANQVEIAGITYPLDEAAARSDALLKRLHQMGVDEIQLVINGKAANTYVSTE